MKFNPGQIVATPGALALFQQLETNLLTFLARHLSGDWGDLGDEDKEMNNAALSSGEDRIFSKYNVTKTDSIYIITEYDRSVTTILLPEEY